MIVWILLKSCCWFNPSLWIVDYFAFQLVCSFQVAYYYRLLRDTLPFPLYALEPPCISLDSLQGHTLFSDKDITLTSMRYHSQGIALLPTAGTPTPNGLRSSWDSVNTNLVGSTLKIEWKSPKHDNNKYPLINTIITTRWREGFNSTLMSSYWSQNYPSRKIILVDV